MAEPRISYAKTSDGISIAYMVLGSGPPIVFSGSIWGNIHLHKQRVPGVGASIDYDEIVSEGWSVITYDARGTGLSSRDTKDWTLEGRLRDLEAVVEIAAPARFALCGEHQGGPAAIAFAVRYPDRVTHLVLCNTYAAGSEWYQLVPAFRMSQQTLGDAEEEWEFVTLSLANAVTGYTDSERARTLAHVFRTGMTAKGFIAFRDAAEKIDVRDLLPKVSVPTLVMHDRTWLIERGGILAQRLAPFIPNARLVDTDNAAKVIDDFLREGSHAQKAVKAGEAASTFRAVLFTDLVGHSEMMSRLGDDRGRSVLREHETITRNVLKRHGGTEVKTMGDGFMASFGSVTRAVECAIALQRAFAEREVGAHHDAPLHVRVGLNAGEPIEEDGDLFGATVILASRIAAKADGGEILVADTVRGLCSGKGFLFADRGEFVAKGFEEPVRVYEVRWRE